MIDSPAHEPTRASRQAWRWQRRWLGTEFLVAVGILVGAAGAFYLIIRRYGGG